MSLLISPLTTDQQKSLSADFYALFQRFSRRHVGRAASRVWAEMAILQGIQCAMTSGGGMTEDEAAMLARELHRRTQWHLDNQGRPQ